MTKPTDTLKKAYGSIPKEVTPSLDLFDFITIRPVKYYWLKLKRRLLGR